MSLLDYFTTKRTQSASIAKERLQILVSHEHNLRNQPSYLPQLQQEILAVIKKYVSVDENTIKINFEKAKNREIIELAIDLPTNPTHDN